MIKKIILIVCFKILFITYIFSQQIITENKKVKYFIHVENDFQTSTYQNSEDYSPEFKKYSNKSLFDTGVILIPNELAAIKPFFKVYDLKWDINSNTKFYFSECCISPGIKFIFSPEKSFKLTTWLANVEKIKPIEGLWAGLSTGAGLEKTFTKYFITLKLFDDFLPLFLVNIMSNDVINLINIATYSFSFNCFNYINEKINSGIYISGKIETTSAFFNSEYRSTTLGHLLLTGFSFNPHKIFRTHLAFLLYNKFIFDSSNSLSVNMINIGLYTGFDIYIKWFSFKFYYKPILYNNINNLLQGITHYIGLNAIISLN